MLTGGIGTLCWCCAQLEPDGIANRYNHLINGDFTFNTDAKLSGWSGKSNNTANDKVYSTATGSQPEGLSGNVLRLYGMIILQSEAFIRTSHCLVTRVTYIRSEAGRWAMLVHGRAPAAAAMACA